jgi:hypothetical protein
MWQDNPVVAKLVVCESDLTAFLKLETLALAIVDHVVHRHSSGPAVVRDCCDTRRARACSLQMK